jgi:hypothetical protein
LVFGFTVSRYGGNAPSHRFTVVNIFLELQYPFGWGLARDGDSTDNVMLDGWLQQRLLQIIQMPVHQ